MPKDKKTEKEKKTDRKRLSFQDLAQMNREEKKGNKQEFFYGHNELDSEDKSDVKTNQMNELSNLFTSKPTMEDTHTRRTFLIRNDLLKQLDEQSDKPKNFTKTKFINYILEKGLKELIGGE